MIDIISLNKYYNKGRKNQLHVIDNVSLKLENNGLIALLGPSGSGKTTLLNAIGGLDKVRSGKIYINGKKITSKFSGKVDKIRNLNIGYIFQDYKLIEDMTVYQNVAIVLKMIGIKDKKEIKTRIEYVLEKVGMYRYKERPVNMLSGGERQRVGIARAIVKAPDIIIADEPTGNLDSKNSLEVMNIIKAISREKLVILVTHESVLANFYADRIIEIKDGKVDKDYKNEHKEELDYQVENKFYLKDFKEIQNIKQENSNINIYSDNKKDLKLDIVVKNGNIYIRSNTDEKIEIVDDNSSIELIDDNYKKIDKKTIEKYKFNFEEIINKNIKKRYSSIINPINMIIAGFRKVFDYPILKKILLGGFFISGMFIMSSTSRILAVLDINDKDFVKYNSNYLISSTNEVKVNDYLQYEQDEGINYILPGKSSISLNMDYDDYYQTKGSSDKIQGSLSSLEMIKQDDLIYGRMPENDYEIVIDNLILDKLINESQTNYAKMIGIKETKDMLGRELYVENMEKFTLVGITDFQNPSIYTARSQFINLISNASSNNYDDESYGFGLVEAGEYSVESSLNDIFDYKLFENTIELKKGKMPENDYEVIVNKSNEETMKLNKTIDKEVNGKKLTVVGYYESKEDINYYFVNNNTIKYKLIEECDGITIYPKNKKESLIKYKKLGLNIKDSYQSAKDDYLKEQKATIKSKLISSGIIAVISLIEIFLMTRASFLSRIKEVGILRAIGVKKKDIYKMFTGEIIAITTIASVPGILIISYILYNINQMQFFKSMFVVNIWIVLLVCAGIYAFNLIVGLIPVFKVIRKRPAQILSRNDI